MFLENAGKLPRDIVINEGVDNEILRSKKIGSCVAVVLSILVLCGLTVAAIGTAFASAGETHDNTEYHVKLKSAVEAGKLTQTEADKKLTGLRERLKNRVKETVRS